MKRWEMLRNLTTALQAFSATIAVLPRNVILSGWTINLADRATISSSTPRGIDHGDGWVACSIPAGWPTVAITSGSRRAPQVKFEGYSSGDQNACKFLTFCCITVKARRVWSIPGSFGIGARQEVCPNPSRGVASKLPG